METNKPTIWPGEEQAWKILTELNPEEVEKNAGVTYDRELSAYILNCFGQVVHVSPKDRNISSNSEIGRALVEELAVHSSPSILNYLIHAKDIPLSGNLVRPADLPGGKIFLQGTHVLPLKKIAQRFNNNSEEFLRKGSNLSGAPQTYGNVSLEFAPLPKFRIVLIVWSGDEEFPPNASLLMDSTCTSHMATDIIWATAKMTIELMLL